MRQLIRFVSEKEHAKQFLAGEIYMNTMGYFWEEGFEDQKDYFEGVSCNISKDKVERLPHDLRDVLCYDIAIRVDVYKYNNICSFYRLDIDNKRQVIQLPAPEINKFGEYAIIILDENKLINRILKKVEKNSGWDVLCGDVNYHKRIDSTDPKKHVRNTLDMILHEPIDLDIILDNKQSIKTRDSFDKMQKYSYQNEWRICLNRYQKDGLAYVLDIGDLSDIAYIVKTTDLRKEIIKKYKGFKLGTVAEQRMSYQGSVSRKKFRRKMLDIDGKVSVMATIG